MASNFVETQCYRYWGSMVNGLPHGSGKMELKEGGATFKGEFVDSLPHHGSVASSWVQGTDCFFKGFLPHGRCKSMEYANGTTCYDARVEGGYVTQSQKCVRSDGTVMSGALVSSEKKPNFKILPPNLCVPNEARAFYSGKPRITMDGMGKAVFSGNNPNYYKGAVSCEGMFRNGFIQEGMCLLQNGYIRRGTFVPDDKYGLQLDGPNCSSSHPDDEYLRKNNFVKGCFGRYVAGICIDPARRMNTIVEGTCTELGGRVRRLANCEFVDGGPRSSLVLENLPVAQSHNEYVQLCLATMPPQRKTFDSPL